MYYSQQNEDRVLHEKFLNYRNGFFIELGAMNGVTFSNTLFFEKNLGWNGVLIEPTNQYNDLIKYRPNCYNFNYAISDKEGELEFLGNHALGGLVESMTDIHRKAWNLDSYGLPYKVKSIPIYKLLENLNIDKVDFFSIDVEGGELEVLSTYDWKIPTYVILIEISKQDLVREEKCRILLREKGFEFDSIIGINEIWVNKNYQKNL